MLTEENKAARQKYQVIFEQIQHALETQHEQGVGTPMARELRTFQHKTVTVVAPMLKSAAVTDAAVLTTTVPMLLIQKSYQKTRQNAVQLTTSDA